MWPHPNSNVEIAFGSIVADRYFDPSPEARARADEIIAAFDQWEKMRDRKKPRGMVAAERKREKASKLVIKLEKQIAKMPATSIAGMIAKARWAQAYDDDCYPECDDPLSVLSASIARDLLVIAEVPAAA